MRGASQRGHENEFSTKFWGSCRPYFRCSSSRTELKKHVFTAMLAQHVASELHMRLWTSRSQTDRNTPIGLKIDLGKSVYNGFFCYNGYNGFLTDFRVFDRFITDF